MEGFLHSRGSPCLHAPQRFLSQAGREYGGYRIRSLESVFIDWPADDVLLAQPSRKNETSVFVVRPFRLWRNSSLQFG